MQHQSSQDVASHHVYGCFWSEHLLFDQYLSHVCHHRILCSKKRVSSDDMLVKVYSYLLIPCFHYSHALHTLMTCNQQHQRVLNPPSFIHHLSLFLTDHQQLVNISGLLFVHEAVGHACFYPDRSLCCCAGFCTNWRTCLLEQFRLLNSGSLRWSSSPLVLTCGWFQTRPSASSQTTDLQRKTRPAPSCGRSNLHHLMVSEAVSWLTSFWAEPPMTRFL